MEYQLKYSGVDESIYLQAKKNGQPLPEFLKNKPTLKKGLHYYMRAFFDLETERQVGFAVFPIPILKIIEYGRFLKHTDEELSDFITIIQSLDAVALKYYRGKAVNADNNKSVKNVQKANK